MSITKSTGTYSQQIERLKHELVAADAVVIGAGAGLSTSAGFVYDGERFEQHFSDFAEKYGLRDMYSGGFYPYNTQEEFWAYWSRYIYVNRYMDAPKPVYDDLLKLVEDRTTLCLLRMSITVFKRRVLTKNGCFTPKAIMACSSVVNRAARKRLKTRI